MKFNRNIVQHILENYFSDEVDDYVLRSIGNLEPDDVQVEFNGEPAYFEFIAVNDMDIMDDIEIEPTTEGDAVVVTGTAILDVEANAIDDERMSCGSTNIAMVFSYSFFAKKPGEYYDLYMEWVD